MPGALTGALTGAILVAGTTSDAGKSVFAAGLCRLLARRGVKVAPFKAQNMSNNSVVTLDGGEIGRAQALQARACGLEPSVRFNPVLLKPGGDRTSQLVVRGRAVANVGAADYIAHRTRLRAVVAEELRSLRAEFDVVVCEGAGSPAEVNLRATDLANMGLARAAHLPVVVVGDIDRGGVLAHFFGTLAVLEPADQALVAGFVVNKFRGDPALLRPGLDRVEALTGRPVLGVVPFADGLWIDAEDSLGVVDGARVGRPRPPAGSRWLRVAAVRLSWVSNSTDVEALACEPGVSVRWTTDPATVAEADLAVLPGSKATVSDLAWLRSTGLAGALADRAAAGRPVLGVCGGYQMLGRTVTDRVESGVGEVAGLGLVDMDVEFAPDKVLAQVCGTAGGEAVSGYEIHHGRVTRTAAPPWITYDNGAPEGCCAPPVWGTHWHGLLENDTFRRRFLADVAAQSGAAGFAVHPGTSVAVERAAQLDLLADLVERNVDVGAVEALLGNGPPADAPTVACALVPIVRAT